MIQTDHLHEVKTYHVTKATAVSVSQAVVTSCGNTCNNAYGNIETTGEGVDVVVTIDVAVLDK